MTLYSHVLEYPEGDEVEMDHPLAFGDLVDLNGNRLSAPLPTARMIAYRVVSMRTREERGMNETRYRTELVSAAELSGFTRS